MKAFDAEKLAEDTRSLLYDVIQPHQRKAVLREVFQIFHEKTHEKVVDKETGVMLVYSHRHLWLDSVCEEVMEKYRQEVTLFPLQCKQLAAERFIKQFHDKMNTHAFAGWRWNKKTLQWQRRNNSTGKAVKASDHLESEKEERKRKIVDYENNVDQAERSNEKQKRQKNDASSR